MTSAWSCAQVTTTVSGSLGALTAVVLSLIRAAAIGGRSHSVDAISLANGLLRCVLHRIIHPATS